MNYGRPELRERLAAEYALGTLRGLARRRFERLLRGDKELRTLVHDWEMRVNLLSESAPATPPPAHLWRAIEQQLDSASAPSASLDSAAPLRPSPAAATGWWNLIGFWRPFGLTAAAAAIALAVFAALRPPALAPEQIATIDQRLASIETKLAAVEAAPSAINEVNDRLARIEAGTADLAGTSTEIAELAERLARMESRIAVSERATSHVAVLLDDQGRPMMTADLDLVDGRLVLRLNITPPVPTAGKALEVWQVPTGGGAPSSLGLFPGDQSGTSIVLPLTPEVARALSTSALAVSLEPSGGSTTGLPSGPVLFSGAVVPVDL